jgi:hypothetical protein
MSLNDGDKELLVAVAKHRGVSVDELLQAAVSGRPSDSAATEQVELSDDEPTVVFTGAASVAQPPVPSLVDNELPAEVPLPPLEVPSSAQESETQVQPEIKHQFCVHCGWDQDVPVIPEVSKKDVNDFLYTCLGQQVYSREYSLLGGHLLLRLRTLHVRELESLYEAAYEAQKVGVIRTPTEYYDHINRNRIFLQLEMMTIKLGDINTLFSLPTVLQSGYAPGDKPDWVSKLKADGIIC